jgi:hypothetical protein
MTLKFALIASTTTLLVLYLADKLGQSWAHLTTIGF